ncbi:unnamed protein product, partial [Discosporangium mesarthrocarpum]
QGHDHGFPLLGQGRYSSVVRARRRVLAAQEGVTAGEGGVPHTRRACALKVVDKRKFWELVMDGRERADALARELLCQTVLTTQGTK